MNQPNEATVNADTPITRKPLRLWPGVLIVIVQWLLRFVVPLIAPEATLFGVPLVFIGVLGGVLCGLLIILWWLFFSRAPWSERLGAIALMIVALIATSRVVDKSIAGGAMGMLLYVLAIPLLSLGLVLWAVASRHLSLWPRRAALVVTILISCGIFTLIRTGGFTADFDNDFHWRWTKTPEQQLLAQTAGQPATLTPVSAATSAATKTNTDWPGFRGPERDGVVRGVRIKTDWTASPPVELWRQPIGPGWSSFAVHNDLIYTQEQRGDDEAVACYSLITGKPVWRHTDAARFYESNAGAGPRGTPSLSNGRVYTLGATGIVNALDASNGKVIWSRNAASDTRTKIPGWGFSSSPLVVDDVVIVATAGNLIAYDVSNGNQRWVDADNSGGYSSPHLVKIGGVAQVVLLNGSGAISVAPNDGKRLWQQPLPPNARIVQPAMTEDGDVLVNDGEGSTMRRISVGHEASKWTVQERWMSEGLTPYFNDFVVHDGYAYGFAGSNLACVDLKDGNQKWKGGKYGHGQLVLLADQAVLVVLSEQGELALVNATPDQFTELARIAAIKGKTWNHPVIAGDVLLVRNGEEMAAYRLTLADH